MAPFNVLIPPFILRPAPGSLSRTKKAAVTVSSPRPRRLAINAAVAASRLLPQLPPNLFSSSIRFYPAHMKPYYRMKRVFVFRRYRCCRPGHFIGISLFSAFMPYGCECVKWTASLLGGPHSHRPTLQRLIGEETVSSFSVTWIHRHLFPSRMVLRCGGVVQVSFPRGVADAEWCLKYNQLHCLTQFHVSLLVSEEMLPQWVEPSPYRSAFHLWRSSLSRVTDRSLLNSRLRTEESLLSGAFHPNGHVGASAAPSGPHPAEKHQPNCSKPHPSHGINRAETRKTSVYLIKNIQGVNRPMCVHA